MNLRLYPAANAKVLAALFKTTEPELATPDSGNEPYYRRGCHPDIVERLWDQIGAAYPPDSRWLVYGTPSLVDPDSGIIVAVGYGTAYCIRIPEDAVPVAIKMGTSTLQKWSSGKTTDIEAEFGEGWAFGAWLDQEIVWTQQACDLITVRSEKGTET